MNVKSRKMDISGEIPASVPVTAAEIFIVVEMASAAAAGMGACAARPVSEKSDVKEGSNAVKAALEETAAKEVFSIRREVSGKTVVKEDSNAVKTVLEETAAKEVFSIRREVSGKTVVKEDSNAVKTVLEETAAKEVFSIRREVSGKTVVKEGSNAVKAVLGETAAEEVFRGVKAGFVSRALEAGPPAVFPAETGAINE